jgi:1-acyl-sn-glycerol-3-phosphate acyltransferase
MFAPCVKLVTGVHARWIGVDPVDESGVAPQRVYFANHASNLDAPTIWSALPRLLRCKTRPIAARDYWDAGPLRRYFAKRIMRAVLVERLKVTKSNNPLLAMEAALDAGDSLILFPEGTRTLDDEGAMNEFKPGLFHLARKYPHVQFVPTYLENLNRILPKGELILVPLLAAVTFGAPVGLGAEEGKQAYLARAKRALEELSEASENA